MARLVKRTPTEPTKFMIDGEEKPGGSRILRVSGPSNSEAIPSGFALAAMSAPMLPAAPGRLSMMTCWDELGALFQDTVADAVPAERVAKVLDLVANLDRGARPRDITAAFVAVPGWLENE